MSEHKSTAKKSFTDSIMRFFTPEPPEPERVSLGQLIKNVTVAASTKDVNELKSLISLLNNAIIDMQDGGLDKHSKEKLSAYSKDISAARQVYAGALKAANFTAGDLKKANFTPSAGTTQQQRAIYALLGEIELNVLNSLKKHEVDPPPVKGVELTTYQ